ncbi:MAG: HAD-IA family hydrolase [Firmicutes bacterium]|nr:HAD family hydrolase [Clostridiales bacterium]MBQ4340699.1 HAD-IA family hydrolase [Bacillota bacterium]
MKIKAVMIDFDGTLANTNGLIIKSHQHTFRTFLGHEGNEKQIKATFGEPLWLTMEKFFGKEYEQEAVNVYRAFQKDRFADLIEVFPGMDKAVKTLRSQGYKVALVTSRLKHSTYSGIERFGLLEDFDVITTLDDITRHKPDPESINVTLEKLGLSPEEAVMIGDSRFDILCAENAGCRSILVDWSVTEEEERIQLNADYIAKNAEDMIRWINEN